MTGGGISCVLSPHQPLHAPQAKSTHPIPSGTTSPDNCTTSAHKHTLEEKTQGPTYGHQSLPSLGICHFIPGFKKMLCIRKHLFFLTVLAYSKLPPLAPPDHTAFKSLDCHIYSASRQLVQDNTGDQLSVRALSFPSPIKLHSFHEALCQTVLSNICYFIYLSPERKFGRGSIREQSEQG